MVGTKLIILSAIFAIGASSSSFGNEKKLVRIPRQTHGKNSQHDQNSAETGFLGGGGSENSKYFHYQHLPEHDKYEFGHKRGNDHHVIERYEKAVPHDGQFKAKVRWADKKGGHGEHYWDYNHAGHGGHGGGEGGHGGHEGGGDKDGGYSDPVVVYTPKVSKQHYKRQSEESDKKITLEDVEASQSAHPTEKYVKEDISGTESSDIQKSKQKRTPESDASVPVEKRSSFEDSQLFFDAKTGKVIDEITGKKYILLPVN